MKLTPLKRSVSALQRTWGTVIIPRCPTGLCQRTVAILNTLCLPSFFLVPTTNSIIPDPCSLINIRRWRGGWRRLLTASNFNLQSAVNREQCKRAETRMSAGRHSQLFSQLDPRKFPITSSNCSPFTGPHSNNEQLGSSFILSDFSVCQHTNECLGKRHVVRHNIA